MRTLAAALTVATTLLLTATPAHAATNHSATRKCAVSRPTVALSDPVFTMTVRWRSTSRHVLITDVDVQATASGRVLRGYWSRPRITTSTGIWWRPATRYRTHVGGTTNVDFNPTQRWVAKSRRPVVRGWARADLRFWRDGGCSFRPVYL